MSRKTSAQLKAVYDSKKKNLDSRVNNNSGDSTEIEGPKGIPDNVLEAVNTQSEIQKGNTDAEIIETTINQMNDKHFVSLEGGKALIYKEDKDHELNQPKLTAFSKESLHLIYGNRVILISDSAGNSRPIPISKLWLNHEARRTYENGLALIPKGEVPYGVYNLWQGFGCIPIENPPKSEVSLILWFILYVICSGNKNAASYVIKWLAQSVQSPEKQAEVALVLLGGKGIGKGVFGRMIRDLFGAHSMHILHSRHLTGNFNAHLRSCLFIFVDESFFAGDKAGNNVLKGLITEDQLAVEKKGIDVFSVRNRLKIIMATNEVHAVIASGDERRFCVLQVSDVKKQDHAYFAELDEWWRNDGMEKFLGYLLHVDISNFNIRLVPNTSALEQQKIESLEPIDAWIYEKLLTGDWQIQVVCKQFSVEFGEYVKLKNLRYVNSSSQSVGAALHRRMEVQTKQQSRGNRQREWILPELDEARKQFAESLGLVIMKWESVE